MAIAWFLAPYKQMVGQIHPTRYCLVLDYNDLIVADGGTWSETEVLGNQALVKVRASASTLATIAADAAIVRIPNHFQLSDTLGDLTAGQRTAIENKLQAMGYTLTELRAVMPAGGWGAVTLGQVLKFAATRRLRWNGPPWFDIGGAPINLNGASDPVRPVDDVDGVVS